MFVESIGREGGGKLKHIAYRPSITNVNGSAIESISVLRTITYAYECCVYPSSSSRCGSAPICAVAALAAFGFETILSDRAVREQAQSVGDTQEK